MRACGRPRPAPHRRPRPPDPSVGRVSSVSTALRTRSRITSASRAAPSSPASHLSSPRSGRTTSAANSGLNVVSALRSRRVATRILWTASGASSRTGRSCVRTCSTCSRMWASRASPAGDVTVSFRPSPERRCVARLQVEHLRQLRGAGRLAQAAFAQARVDGRQEVDGAVPELDLDLPPRRRGAGRVPAGRRWAAACAPSTRSSATSATHLPGRVHQPAHRPVGDDLGDRAQRGRPGSAPTPSAAAASGTVRVARPSGRRTSERASVPAGTFRCQPASSPPVRRRRVRPAAARRRSAVSK